MNATRAVERVVVNEGDHQVASQVGLHLLGELADRAGLTSAYSAAVPWAGERAPGHDRVHLLTHVAVALAGGGVCVDDVAALRDQPDLFGEVASAATIWRAVHEVDGVVLDALRRAQATARTKVWEAFGAEAVTVLDVDAAGPSSRRAARTLNTPRAWHRLRPARFGIQLRHRFRQP